MVKWSIIVFGLKSNQNGEVATLHLLEQPEKFDHLGENLKCISEKLKKMKQIN